MTRRLVKVPSVRDANGKPSRLPRVSDPAHGLTAAGWTVYTEHGLFAQAGLALLRGAVRLVVALVVLAVRGLVALARYLVASGGMGAVAPLRRCAGCGLCLRARRGVGLVALRTGSTCCPVTVSPMRCGR